MQTWSDRKSMMVFVCVYVLRAIFININIGSMAERRMVNIGMSKMRGNCILALLFKSHGIRVRIYVCSPSKSLINCTLFLLSIPFFKSRKRKFR